MFSQPSNRLRFAWLLFALFALMQVNLVVFRHGHRLPSGRIITHAHPFWPDGKGPIKANPHSAAELFLLDAVTNGSFAGEEVQAIEFQVPEFVFAKLIFDYSLRSNTRPVSCLSLRGPPTAFVAA